MKSLIESGFEVLAVLFDKIPFLSKLKGYRSVLGFVGLAVVNVLSLKGVVDQTTANILNGGFIAYTGLALNAKGRGE